MNVKLLVQLPDELIADLRVLQQKTAKYQLAAALSAPAAKDRAAQELMLAAGCLTEYLPAAEAPALEKTP